MAKQPRTFAELFTFYHDYVKLLYSSVQASNALPAEVLFELNAALDHIARLWIYKESEEQVVEKAFGHLKRSCLDIFKLRVAEAIDQFEQLIRIDTSEIDGGQFDQQLHKLAQEIKREATEARRLEGDTRNDQAEIGAFQHWQPVFTKCIELENNFYNNPQVDWSKTRLPRNRRSRKTVLLAIVLVIGIFIGWLLARMFR